MFDSEFLTEQARARVGRSVYKRKADPADAPEVVDCSSFIQWLFSLEGVLLPRLAFEQLGVCQDIIFDPNEARPGDLIFKQGRQPQYHTDPNLAVGHVGFVTKDLTVIHAPNKDQGVVEENSIIEFFHTKSTGVCIGRLHKGDEHEHSRHP